MTFRIPLFMVAALLIAGCTPQDTPPDPPAEPDDATTFTETVAVSYTCQSGAVAEASYWDNDATVLYAGETYNVSATEAASGVRYTDDSFVWWTDGNEATVYALDAEGNMGDPIDTCTQTVTDWVEGALDDAEDAAGDVVDDIEEGVEGAIEDLEEATDGE